MSGSSHLSPLHYKELEDSFVDANFKVDISQKMKVPNKLSFNENGVSHNWSESIDMQVPERILAIGQQQFAGSRGGPREIDFDHSLMANTDPFPCDPRVATPPRTLTLDRYPFPGINDGIDDDDDEEQEASGMQIPVVNRSAMANSGKFNNNSVLDDSELMQMSIRENTPPLGRSGVEEIPHLRKQLAKLNRRVLELELENFSRLQREKILYGIGIAYFLLKTIIWLNRN